MIPRSLLDRMALGRGGVVEISEHCGRIQIEPVPTRMSLAKRWGRVVAVPRENLPPLTDDIVRSTIERTRKR